MLVLTHAGDELAGEKERRGEIEIDGVIPALGSDRIDRLAQVDAGGVDDDGHRTDGLLTTPRDILKSISITEIRCDGDGLTVAGADLRCRGLERVLAPRHQHHRGAGICQSDGHGAADAGARTGHHRHATGEVEERLRLLGCAHRDQASSLNSSPRKYLCRRSSPVSA